MSWFELREASQLFPSARQNQLHSVCAFLGALLIDASETVGLYTSPHLVSTTERYRFNGEDIPDLLSAEIRRNKEVYEFGKTLRLPQLIVDQSEVYDFYLSECEPNFVTQGRVAAKIVCEDGFEAGGLTGKIAFIES